MSKKAVEYLFFLVCFIALFVFFSIVHPLVPYDGDDWYFLSAFRAAYPYWGSWNPVKVLPETIMPLCGYVSAYLIHPLIGDYVTSITICSALIISIAVTTYFYSIYILVDKAFNLPFMSNLSILFLFILFHFMFFLTNEFNNTYIFYSQNLTCYFHYLLPALLNAVLVLYLFQFNDLLEINIQNNSSIVLALYLAIFSNIFHSIILAMYVFVRLIRAIFNISNKNKFYSFDNIKTFMRENLSWLIVVALWLVSLVFEAHGGRANQIGNSIFALPVKQTLYFLKNLLKQIPFGLTLLMFLTFWIARIFFLKSKEKDCVDFIYREMIVQSFFCFILVLFYTFLVSAKAFPKYIGNANVAFSFLFYIFVMLYVSIAYIIKKHPDIKCLLPCICLVAVGYVFNSDMHFRENNIKNIAPYKCVLVDNDLIHQIVEADRTGKNQMVLTVPIGDNHDNWPHPLYMGANISRTLYTHGIISKKMEISIKPDENMNRKYHLGY